MTKSIRIDAEADDEISHAIDRRPELVEFDQVELVDSSCVLQRAIHRVLPRGAVPLFVGRRGARPTRWWLGYHCKALCARAGVPAITPHGLRGTHGSIARRGGATGEIVAAQLGHASSAITNRGVHPAGGVAGSPDDRGAARHRGREAMRSLGTFWELDAIAGTQTRVSMRASGGTRTP